MTNAMLMSLGSAGGATRYFLDTGGAVTEAVRTQHQNAVSYRLTVEQEGRYLNVWTYELTLFLFWLPKINGRKGFIPHNQHYNYSHYRSEGR